MSPEITRLINAKLGRLFAKRLRKLPDEVFNDFVEIFNYSDNKESRDKLAAIAATKSDRKRLTAVKRIIKNLLDDQRAGIGADLLRGAEREIYMQVLDVLWMQHLENMQNLREGIQWRSVGQRDPLVEYRSESQKLFESLEQTLQDEVLRVIFHLQRSEINAKKTEDDQYDSDLTRAANSAEEQGVNEVGAPTERDDEFKPAKSQSAKNHAKNTANKKKKQQRQNRKRSRR